MKLLRIETRSGQVRYVQLAPYPGLPSWVQSMRRDGWLVGPEWAMPFDAIALIDCLDVVEGGAGKAEVATLSEPPRPSESIAAAIASGQWPYKIVE